MTLMTRVRAAAGVAALAMVTTACNDREPARVDEPARSPGAAAGDAARDAGNAAAGAARSAGDAVANAGRAADAAVETMDVKAALMADSRVDASDINVDTNHETKTVVLKGRVTTAAQKAIAEQIAIGKAAGYRVQNDLIVR
jgi:hyperosmotically inducible periplasmic protein